MKKLKQDGAVTISTGKSRTERKWKQRTLTYSELVDMLSKTIRTHETFEEYKQLPKGEQDEIKDVGGFVGGELQGGVRRKDSVTSRSLITLDADYAVPGFWDIIEMFFDFALCMYSTHKHSAERPRLRLVIPLKRPVSTEEYEAAARRVAFDLGIDYFDDTTFEPERLMYWPSTSSDGIFEFNFQDAQWLDPDEVLKGYKDWRDTSSWPESSRAGQHRQRLAEKQGNPREKSGIVGAFCRSYSMSEAIESFLRETYVKSVEENRYTYTKASTAGGLVVYENGDFAYSHHGTDPASGRLCNAFDLVRIHKFGQLDKEAAAQENTSKLPSFSAMLEFCRKDDRVKVNLGEERLSRARQDFQALEEEAANNEWLKLLDLDKHGFYRPTRDNITLILENDPYLKGKIAHNEFSHITMARGHLPWRQLVNLAEGEAWEDSDDASLRHYIEKVYGITITEKVSDALTIVEKKNRYHPIRQYLQGLQWDGAPRVESLLIEYLGAEDSIYTRTVTRKILAAAVARVFQPGVKFDYMLVLVGRQGIGKSHLISLLGKSWYSDSVNTVLGKEAYEQLQEAWILEMAELSAAKKAEAEAVKHFISKKEDIYRVAYGKRVTKFPRQCVFFGTTNENEFLKDTTGNRRYWAVKAGVCGIRKSLWSQDIHKEIDQVWAEAYEFYKGGETLYLEGDMEKEAAKIQELHIEQSDKEGMISEFLELLLPENWAHMDLGARRRFIHGGDFGEAPKGTARRDKVCALEIWMELFQGDTKLLTHRQSLEINDILKRLQGWEAYNSGIGRLRFGKIYGPQKAYVRKA
jgi:putative DNA primase/helicase